MLGRELGDRVKLVDAARAVQLLSLPRGHCLLGSEQALQEDLGAIDPADDRFPIVIGDAEQTVTVFEIGGALDKDRRVQTSKTHTPYSPHPESTERRPGCAGEHVLAINGLETISFFRWAPANDNPANDTWSPLDAA